MSQKKMGVSKKKLKNVAKSKRKMTPKGKKKVKEARRIEKVNKHKASKRKATALVNAKVQPKQPVSCDMKTELSAVDKLFADVAEGEEDEEVVPQNDGSDESSAGAFHDVGDGLGDDEENDLDPIELGAEVDAGAKHEEELKAIKEKDPEFYRFLVESDKALLDFRAPGAAEEEDDEESEEEDEGDGKKKAKAKAKKSGKSESSTVEATRKILTLERLHDIQNNVLNSFAALKVSITIFHIAVKSIERRQKTASDATWKEVEAERKSEELKKKDKAKWLAQKKQERYPQRPRKKKGAASFEIEDEAVFSEVIEWSLKNILGAFRHHAGKLKKGPSDWIMNGKKRNKKKPQKPKKEEYDDDPEPGTAVDVTRYKKWTVLMVPAKLFWVHVLILLNELVDPEMIEFTLRHTSSAEAISWLWPFQGQRTALIKKCVALWSQATSPPIRLLSFLVLRNVGAMALQIKDSQKVKVPMLDNLLRTMFKAFAQAASTDYNWRAFDAFRVMENCFVEMLRLDDVTAYRMAYVCIRQLALVLRNSSIMVQASTPAKGQNSSMARGKSKKAVPDKEKKKKVRAEQASRALTGWSFVRGLYLWTKAVGSLPSLRELAYPLNMVIMGAVKSRMSKLTCFPFVYHCLTCQNRLAAALEVYVPISSHILKLFDQLNIHVEKAFHKQRKARYGKKDQEHTVVSAKVPEVEVLTHFAVNQQYDNLLLETVGSNLLHLLTDHMGLLSRSPAFPELVSMVLMHVRKHRKHCGSEALRRQLTTFIQAAESSAEEVRARRDLLKEVPSSKKFLHFDADTPLAKLRVTLMKRKADEERQRYQAELTGNRRPSADSSGDAKKKRKNKQQREAEADEAEAKTTPNTVRKKKRPKGAKEEAHKEDKVEEMAFSSGED